MELILTVLAFNHSLRVVEGELRYWDSQWEKQQEIKPKGREQRRVYKESETFYYARRAELLNKINDINYERYNKPRTLRS